MLRHRLAVACVCLQMKGLLKQNFLAKPQSRKGRAEKSFAVTLRLRVFARGFFFFDSYSYPFGRSTMNFENISAFEKQIETFQLENQRLRRGLEELALLNELAREIGASVNTQEIIQSIIRRSLRAVHAEQGVITLLEPETIASMKTLVRTRVSSMQQPAFHLEQSLQGWMLLHKKPLVVNDPQHDERFRGAQWENSIRSLVCVPLLIKSELKGIFTLYNKKTSEGFSTEDQRLLGIIAAQSAQVIENARLYEEEQALLRMQQEMKLATKIQLELLPKHAPKLSGYDLAGKSIPAQSVGGDYFDFIAIDEHRLALCVGDISGKGLPAAMLMANLQATMRSLSLTPSSVGECLGRANRLLHQSTDSEKFATLFYGVLDTRQHSLCYSNAGHNDPFVLSLQSAPRLLKIGGIMLGLLPQRTFAEETIALAPGEVLVIYSDGISEAVNVLDEQFGEERLLEVMREHWQASASELVERVLVAVQQHAGSAPQADDMTIMIVRRVAE